MNKKLKFEHNMHNSRTHPMNQNGFDSFDSFSCKLNNKKSWAEIKRAFNWTML